MFIKGDSRSLPGSVICDGDDCCVVLENMTTVPMRFSTADLIKELKKLSHYDVRPPTITTH